MNYSVKVINVRGFDKRNCPDKLRFWSIPCRAVEQENGFLPAERSRSQFQALSFHDTGEL